MTRVARTRGPIMRAYAFDHPTHTKRTYVFLVLVGGIENDTKNKSKYPGYNLALGRRYKYQRYEQNIKNMLSQKIFIRFWTLGKYSTCQRGRLQIIISK